MELPGNKVQVVTKVTNQLVAQAVNRSTRTIKLAVNLVIICALISYITVIIVHWEDSFVAELFTMHFIMIICLTFIPLVLTYFRFKNAYKECYSKEFIPTDILKYIDKQRRIFVIINICRSILFLGFLPEFPLYSFFRYTFNEALNEYEAEPRTEQHFNRALAIMVLNSTVMLVLIIAFNAIVDLNVFRQKFGKLFNSGLCVRCGTTIEVDVTNLYCIYCRVCEKLRKEIEKAHFLPNPQQKALISSYMKPLKYAALLQHVCFLVLFMKLIIWHSNLFIFLISTLLSYAFSEFLVAKYGIYDKFSSTFSKLIVFPYENNSIVGLRKAKSLRNIAIVLILIRASLILLVLMLSVKTNLTWIGSRDFLMDENSASIVCVSVMVVVFGIGIFYFLQWAFFSRALIKLAGPELCPWCARRPIVKQLESDGQSKEDERRGQFKSCEECLRMQK